MEQIYMWVYIHYVYVCVRVSIYVYLSKSSDNRSQDLWKKWKSEIIVLRLAVSKKSCLMNLHPLQGNFLVICLRILS